MSRKKKKKPDSNSELLQYYLYQGAEILEPCYLKKWREIVDIRLQDLFFENELDDALELADLLNRKIPIFEVCDQIHRQEHSEFSARLTLAIVERICARGSELETYFFPPY